MVKLFCVGNICQRIIMFGIFCQFEVILSMYGNMCAVIEKIC